MVTGQNDVCRKTNQELTEDDGEVSRSIFVFSARAGFEYIRPVRYKMEAATKISIKPNDESPPDSARGAVRTGGLVYVNGQVGSRHEDGVLVEDLDGQTLQMLANVDAILACAGLSKANIVMVTLMFSDMRYFKRVDEIYADWIPPREEIPLPGVTAFASNNLPHGALTQIDVVASVPCAN